MSSSKAADFDEIMKSAHFDDPPATLLNIQNMIESVKKVYFQIHFCTCIALVLRLPYTTDQGSFQNKFDQEPSLMISLGRSFKRMTRPKLAATQIHLKNVCVLLIYVMFGSVRKGHGKWELISECKISSNRQITLRSHSTWRIHCTILYSIHFPLLVFSLC